jgi:hypothetical protein
MSPVRRMVRRQSEMKEPKGVRINVEGALVRACFAGTDGLRPIKGRIFAVNSVRDGERP